MPAEPNAVRRTAVIAGASGLIGSRLLERLLAEELYARLVAPVRRPLPLLHAKLALVPATYERLDTALEQVARGGLMIDVFCCLGTTRRRAGSHAAFRQIDHDYVLALGHWAKAAGARRMVHVSAMGAHPDSRLFYSRVKGETERDLARLGLASLVVVRPSLLAGERSEFRLGERLALTLASPLRALLPASLRPIDASDVAQAMLDAALVDEPPSPIESAAMQGAASRRGK